MRTLAQRKFLIFRERYIHNTDITDPSYIWEKVYSKPQYIQELGISRTRAIFRILVYSEHCHKSSVERCAKNNLNPQNFFPQNFLLFPETELSSVLFQEVTFRARKMKKKLALKKLLVFQEKELSSFRINKKLFIL